LTVIITALTDPTQGTSQAFGINGNIVVGEETDTGGKPQGFYYNNGSLTILGPTAVYAVNSYREMVGETANYSFFNAETWYQSLGSAAYNLSALYSVAYAVNTPYQYVGWASTDSGENEAFLDDHGKITFLGTLNNAVAPGTTAIQLSAGPISSSAQGINDGGAIVGYSVYGSSSTATHAFLWQSGTMTDLGTLSGGSQSGANAINATGEIVGWSNSANGTHAVAWIGSTLSDLGTLTGYNSSDALALDSTGRIVGSATDAQGNQHAVLWRNGAITDLNSLLPANSGWILNVATGITSQGLIVGTGLDNGVQTAFELSLDGPTAPLTTALGVVQAFQAGLLTTPASIYDTSTNIDPRLDALETVAAAGLLKSITPSDSTVILTPQQLSSDALALSKIQSGISFYVDTTAPNVSVTAISGHPLYFDFSGTPSQYAITATGDGSDFTITDVSTGRTSTDMLDGVFRLDFEGSSIYPLQAGSVTAIAQTGGFNNSGSPTPIDINDEGLFSGILGSTASPSSDQAVLWSAAHAIVWLKPLSGSTASQAYHIDAAGDAVGDSFTANSSGSSTGTFIATLWSAAAASSGAPPTDLGMLAGDLSSLATGINDNGQVVGESLASSTSIRGFLWQNGSMISLGSLGGQKVFPYSINDAGQVVGQASLASGQSHAFLWQNGVMTDLGMLQGGTSSQAEDINASGVAVGSTTLSSGLNRATEWKSGQIIDLGTLPGGTASVANEINAQGWVVGESSTSTGANHAVLWADGTVIDLNSLLPVSAGWVLMNATAISDNGFVAGTGTDAGYANSFSLEMCRRPPCRCKWRKPTIRTASSTGR
jgi:probable HAF family extracellular repeat protein